MLLLTCEADLPLRFSCLLRKDKYFAYYEHKLRGFLYVILSVIFGCGEWCAHASASFALPGVRLRGKARSLLPRCLLLFLFSSHQPSNPRCQLPISTSSTYLVPLSPTKPFYDWECPHESTGLISNLPGCKKYFQVWQFCPRTVGTIAGCVPFP